MRGRDPWTCPSYTCAPYDVAERGSTGLGDYWRSVEGQALCLATLHVGVLLQVAL